MKALKIASIAAALATLALLPATACDYSHTTSNVTASATPAPAAEVLVASPAAEPAAITVAPPAGTQTAETTATTTVQPKLN